MKDVSASEFQALLSTKPEALLLDVRTPEEWQEGHLDGAVHHDYWGDERLFALAMDAIPETSPCWCIAPGADAVDSPPKNSSKLATKRSTTSKTASRDGWKTACPSSKTHSLDDGVWTPCG